MGALSTLSAHEAVIRDGLQTFVAVGNALAAIRDGKLYRETHKTFEDYCSSKWNMVASRARQLIAAAETVEAVESVTTVTPSSEAQTRPLAGLEPEQQREAWTAAVEASDGKPTAKDVAAAVENIAPKPARERVNYTPANGLQYADMAIANLAKIAANDSQRSEAFQKVQHYITRHE
jgi:hypothetical protein